MRHTAIPRTPLRPLQVLLGAVVLYGFGWRTRGCLGQEPS